MTDFSFTGLFIVLVIGCAAPVAVAKLPSLRFPSVVIEIVAGIVVGPVLHWVKLDAPIDVISVVGLAFVLFLVGLELDLTSLRGPLLRLTSIGFVATLASGVAVGAIFQTVGWISDPVFLAITLSATSLGLVVPVLKDARQSDRPLGRSVIASATVADFGAIILLSLLFSQRAGGTASRLLAVAALVLGAAALVVTVRRGRRSSAVLQQLQDTTAQIRVRLAVTLLIGLVALASRLGLEMILGAFVAGIVAKAVDGDTMSHPNFLPKLEAIGYGFVIPVFFVSTGVRFGLAAVTSSASSLARVPLFLVALLFVHAVPVSLNIRSLGWRSSTSAALLQATSLPFIVTAVTIGTAIGAVTAATGAALVAAGLVSVIMFPPLALSIMRNELHSERA